MKWNKKIVCNETFFRTEKSFTSWVFSKFFQILSLYYLSCIKFRNWTKKILSLQNINVCVFSCDTIHKKNLVYPYLINFVVTISDIRYWASLYIIELLLKQYIFLMHIVTFCEINYTSFWIYVIMILSKLQYIILES